MGKNSAYTLLELLFIVFKDLYIEYKDAAAGLTGLLEPTPEHKLTPAFSGTSLVFE